MRCAHVLVALSASLAVAGASSAQSSREAWTPLQLAAACAMPPNTDLPDVATLRIVGAQDTVRRAIYDEHDQLVISGGSLRHVEVGQRYFVRHPEMFGVSKPTDPHSIRTAGWIKVISVNDSMAIAAVEHVCSDITEGDFLESFTAPAVPDLAPGTGDLDFDHAVHILNGELMRQSGGTGDFMLIDQGADDGAAVGGHFTVYRDLFEHGLPLTEIGEAVVMSVGPKMSVVRITRARDAVVAGDYAVPRK